jgi:hypothetical protein
MDMQLTTARPTAGARNGAAWTIALYIIIFGFYGGLYAFWLSGEKEAYRDIIRYLGVAPWSYPFVDLQGVLSWGDCSHAGVDVYKTNPCDTRGQVFNYSPFLLEFPLHWIGRANFAPAALIINGAFLALLPILLRPSSLKTFLVSAAASLSTTVLFAVERANLDVFEFTLIAIGVLLAANGRRTASYALYFTAGLLKLYPFVLLLTMMREPPRVFLRLAAGTALLLALFVMYYAPQLGQIGASMPQIYVWRQSFGAKVFPMALTFFGFSRWSMPILIIGLMLFAFLTLRFTRMLRAAWPEIEASPHFDSLLAGSLLTLGCFFGGGNFDYRAVILIFALPALSRSSRRTLALVACGILFLLWKDFFANTVVAGIFGRPNSAHPASVLGRSYIAFTFFREAVWWAVAAFFSGFVIAFALESPIARSSTNRAAERARAACGRT